jgi:hypothetical protein
MWKVVRGTVDELEAKLNEAAAEGYTEMAREFFEPGPVRLAGVPLVGELAAQDVVELKPPAPQVYCFLMRKPRSPLDDVEPMLDSIRKMASSLGLKMPPIGDLASVPLPPTSIFDNIGRSVPPSGVPTKKKKRRADDSKPAPSRA